jgi:hypothetical protein
MLSTLVTHTHRAELIFPKALKYGVISQCLVTQESFRFKQTVAQPCQSEDDQVGTADWCYPATTVSKPGLSPRPHAGTSAERGTARPILFQVHKRQHLVSRQRMSAESRFRYLYV